MQLKFYLPPFIYIVKWPNTHNSVAKILCPIIKNIQANGLNILYTISEMFCKYPVLLICYLVNRAQGSAMEPRQTSEED